MSDPVSLCFHRLTAALASLRPFARAGSALVGSSGLESRFRNASLYFRISSRSSSLHFSPTRLSAGGLKWTRTTDLTLIRRAL